VCQDLAELPRCTVWILRRFENGIIAFEQLGANPVQELLTEAQYLDRLRAWWYPAAWTAVTPRNPPELTAADLKQVEVEVLALARKRGR
jgi:hypothetical protein